MKTFLANSRVKSFLWRTGMMILAVIIGALLSNIDILAPYLSPAVIGVLGLILGEISKAINNYLSSKN